MVRVNFIAESFDDELFTRCGLVGQRLIVTGREVAKYGASGYEEAEMTHGYRYHGSSAIESPVGGRAILSGPRHGAGAMEGHRPRRGSGGRGEYA